MHRSYRANLPVFMRWTEPRRGLAMRKIGTCWTCRELKSDCLFGEHDSCPYRSRTPLMQKLQPDTIERIHHRNLEIQRGESERRDREFRRLHLELRRPGVRSFFFHLRRLATFWK